MDPEPSVAVEVIALSPRTLAPTSRSARDACGEGFLREQQSQQLPRRGHDAHGDGGVLRAPGEVARTTGRHNRRRRGERKWKCDLCGKRYAADHDWAAHARVCGAGNKAQTRDRGGASGLGMGTKDLVNLWTPVARADAD